MPTERGRMTDADGLIPAAVVVPEIHAEDGCRLLFTRRAPDLDTHPGQMSFPGGRFEPSDTSLEATALRETEEEVGLAPDAVELTGRLEPIETVTGFHVAAFVGRVPNGPFEPQQAEVAEVVTLSRSAFLDDASYEAEYHERDSGEVVPVHYFHVDGHTVWGATGSLLVQYLERTTGWTPPVDR